MTQLIATTPDGYQLTAVSDSPDIRDRYYEPALIQLKSKIEPEYNLLHVRDQGQEGACTGFGLAAVIDNLNKKRYNDTRVSARMLYEMAKRHDEWPGEGYDGSSCRGAIRGWHSMGVCSEEMWPYEVDDDSNLTVRRAKDARNNTLGAYYRLRPDIVDFHAALNEVGVLYVSANVHRGWWRSSLINYDGMKVIPFHRTNEGGHAFAIVGYNEKGFFVQNSWGLGWGKEGVALWTYEDWQKNVSDAWVLRMAIPTPQIFQTPVQPANRGTQREELFQSPSRAQIAGHFVHIDDGNFDSKGRYWSTRDDVKQTANHIEASRDYQHLLLYAHGGLNSTKNSATRINAMKQVFKDNGIYPYHIMYDTGLMEEIKDVLTKGHRGASERVGGFSDWWDKQIEKLTRKAGRALWREMKQGATSPFEPSRAGSHVINDIIGAVRNNGNIKLHLAGHSTGAILIANLLQATTRLFTDPLTVGTVTLMAPACSCELFETHYRPHLEGQTTATIRDCTVYNLTEKQELDDNVAQIYRKSLLYLVSRAFEDDYKTPILGMQKYSKHIEAPNLSFIYSGRGSHSRSESHGGFDNDPTTMNHMLSRILGGEPGRVFTKEDLNY